MATHYTGTLEDRLARMDKDGVRCDGNTRRCHRTAVDSFELLPADGNGVAKPGAEKVTRQTCSLHRRLYLYNGAWVVVAQTKIPLRDLKPMKIHPSSRLWKPRKNDK